jgi:hypothetical protein
MAEKKSFLNWVGFTGEDESSNQPSSVDRIRELEAQIADLKSRRDITGLTKAESLMESKKREISTLATAARREGERIITEATTEVSGYRQWLAGVISEAERLYRIQKQSLDAAESAIQQSRNRLDGAFARLEELQKSVLDNLNADDTLINPGPLKVSSQRTRPALAAPAKAVKASTKKAAKKAPAKKSAAKKTAKR